MLTIQNYVKANTLEEAYELNQARNSRILGGMMWLRLGNARIKTAIDLSGLGLDQIEETDRVFKIGAMCTLRQLETHTGLREFFGDTMAESVRHIVGVQFRNPLHDGGTIRLSEFVKRKKDKDLLVSVIIRKSDRKVRYESIRQTKTDFPVLTCAVVTGVVNGKETWYVSVGARPMHAALVEKEWEISKDTAEDTIAAYAKEAAACYTYGTNMRGSAAYRQHLAEVLIARAIRSILTEE